MVVGYGSVGGYYEWCMLCKIVLCVFGFLAVPSKHPANLLFLLVRVDSKHSTTAVVLLNSFVAAFYVLKVYASCVCVCVCVQRCAVRCGLNWGFV